jgi:hypothetical protein
VILGTSMRLFPVGSTTNLKHAPLSRVADFNAVRSYLPRGSETALATLPVKHAPAPSAHEPTSFIVAVGLVRLDTHGV